MKGKELEFGELKKDWETNLVQVGSLGVDRH